MASMPLILKPSIAEFNRLKPNHFWVFAYDISKGLKCINCGIIATDVSQVPDDCVGLKDPQIINSQVRHLKAYQAVVQAKGN